ncbi:MAG: prepilin-type N-terminal cleavage/methylation domain-containing protein [Acidaminococcaceae bacterium]
MKMLHSKKGFTLIELVVVIAILGILAGIAIPRFMDATASARGSKIVADMRTIDSAIMIYNAKTGALPAKTTDLTTVAAAGTANPTTYKLLAAWPVPPTGTATVQGYDGKELTITPTAAVYTLDTTATSANYGRALYGALTVDDILKITK